MSAIPKIIHYCWFGGKPLPRSAIKCINSWKKHFPDYEIREWNERNFDINMIPYTREAYTAKKYAFVSDFARFWVLHKHGGIYFDTDVEVIRTMADIIEKGAYLGMEPPSSINPGLGMAAPAKHPFYAWYLNYYNNKHFVPEQPSMVPVVTSYMKEKGWKTDCTIQVIDEITIYPSDYFCPQVMMRAPINITNNTRSIHHFDATWMPTWIRLMIIIKTTLKNLLTIK